MKLSLFNQKTISTHEFDLPQDKDLELFAPFSLDRINDAASMSNGNSHFRIIDNTIYHKTSNLNPNVMHTRGCAEIFVANIIR